MEQERRQWTRIKPTQLVYVELGADNGGMVRDISENGIGFCAVSAVGDAGKIAFSFTPDGERRLAGNAESAWTDETGKVGGLRFLDVSDQFRGDLHNWLGGHRVPAGSVPPHVPAAAAPLDNLEQAPPDVLSESPKTAKEGPSPRANAMRMAVDAAVPARKDPAHRATLDTVVLPDEGNEIGSQEVQARWPPTIVEEAREASGHRDGMVWRTSGALFLGMLLVVLFLFRQEAGDGLIWLGQKIAGEPHASPIHKSAEGLQAPAPLPDASKMDSPGEETRGVVKKPPSPAAKPGQIAAPSGTLGPAASGQSASSRREPVQKANSQTGSPPGPMPLNALRENKADSVQDLWAQVAKGEISAELALADLYVRGDRVPKNCAQARVLLSAAAKKGNQLAVRKLIDLESRGGGCANSAQQ